MSVKQKTTAHLRETVGLACSDSIALVRFRARFFSC